MSQFFAEVEKEVTLKAEIKESNHPEKEVILKVELGDPNIPEKEDGSMTELLLLGSREAERNLLVLLNKRLERIIEKNRQLQAANNQLMTQVR